MAAAAGDSNGGEKSAFRWLDVLRYAMAAVVTVVIAAVVVEAVKVVFRRDSLALSVVGSSVNITERLPPPKEALYLQFTLRARNPSGRVRLYYSNITASLFDNGTDASTASPDHDSIIFVKPPDVAVGQRQYVDTIKLASAEKDSDRMLPRFFDILYQTGGEISDVTMRVDGYLVTELGRNSTPASTTYYCKQLVVGLILGKTAMENTQEAPCTTYL